MKLSGILDKIIPAAGTKNEPFIALEITPEVVKVALWTNKEGIVELLGTAQKEYIGDWNEVVRTVDNLIAEASSSLPENENAQKVIFGLPSFWIKENKIEPEPLANLKKLCNSLDLKPLGFVTIPEAIANFLQKQEGAPLTAILIGINKGNISVSLVRIGKMDRIVIKPKTEKITDDITAAFSEFTNVEVLPSRILLFDSEKDLENIKQELIDFPWQTKGSFLHFPKIEILETDTDVKAVALAGGMELGQAMDIRLTEETQGTKHEDQKEKENETLGFIKERDILEAKPLPEPQEKEPQRDISTETPEGEPAALPARKFSLALPKISLPQLALPITFNFIGKTKLFFAGTVAITASLVLITSAFYWYLPKADIYLLVDPKILEKNEEVIGDVKTSNVDETNKIIPITVVEIVQSGDKSATATGKKTIGDKARGEVVVYNKTNNSKTFKIGDILISGNNLKFSLEADATIASQSVSKTGTTFGTGKVKVVAMQIGSEGNLQANTEFSFKDYPQTSYAAGNDVAFTGGSSREVTVVSKDDQNKLLESLLNDLDQKAKEEQPNKIPDGSIPIESDLEPQITKKTFDKEEGIQSENVKLNLEIKRKIPTYKASDLEKIINKQFTTNIPEGYEFRPSDLVVQSRVKEVKKDGNIIFSAHFKAKLLPKIDTELVKKNIVGKNPKVVETYFRSLPNLAGFEMVLKPQLPKVIQTLPHNSNNISIAVNIRK